jgi:hypothetical protein
MLHCRLTPTVVERGGVGHPLIKVRPSERDTTHKVSDAAVPSLFFLQLCSPDLQAFLVAWLIQSWANTFVRLSILDLFADIFRISRFTKIVYVFEGLTILYLLACTIIFFSICRPFKYNWELSPTPRSHCGNLNMKFLLSAIFNLTLDVCIIILPIPMLWNLQLNVRKKAALTVVFGLGIL